MGILTNELIVQSKEKLGLNHRIYLALFSLFWKSTKNAEYYNKNNGYMVEEIIQSEV